MHFEILVEDASGKKALQHIMEKILNSHNEHTYKIIPYKGIGRLPKDLKGKTDPRKRILLDQLPKLLRGYGKSFKDYPAIIIVVVDLDNKNCIEFKEELLAVLHDCNPRPEAFFRIAIEEGEAWLLGDRKALEKAYPRADKKKLNSYKQDSICGTWELLADAVYPGGATKLKELGRHSVGKAKCEWSDNIGQFMDVDANASKSFQVFRDCIRKYL